MPFSRLDRYVFRTAIASYLICALFLVGMFVLFRIVDQMPKVIDAARKVAEEPYRSSFMLYAAGFYVVELPYIFLWVAPFLTVIASMFAVSQLMATNELLPMIFTGRSVHRVLAPIFVLACCGIGLMVATRQFVVPLVSEQRDFLQGLVLKGDTRLRTGTSLIVLDDDRSLHFDSYRPKERVMENVRVNDLGAIGVSSFQFAREAAWVEDQAGGRWKATGGTREDSLGTGQPKEKIAVEYLDLPAHVTPEFIRRSALEPEELVEVSYTDLVDLMQRRPNVRSYVVAFHYHLTFPLANIVLLLLALPFALNFERGSKVGRMFAALAVCGAFLITDLICRRLGNVGTLHPLMGAWLPTVFFGSMAVVVYDTVGT